jgi:hypothetical protein
MSNVIKYERTEQGVRIVPIYREESKQFFVDPVLVPLWEVELDGVKLQTGALKIGPLFDLLGISQSESLLEAGVNDITDSINPAMSLESIWVQWKTADGRGNVSQYVLADDEATSAARFNFGAYHRRSIELNYATESLASGDGGKLDLHVAGTVNLELGHCEIVASGVHATPDNGIAYEVIGYTLKAFRENLNRRPVATDLNAKITAMHSGTVLGHPHKHAPSIESMTSGAPVLSEADAEQVSGALAEEAEQEYRPRISGFSGLEYDDTYFRPGKLIDSHEVTGAASNLQIRVDDEPAQPGGANHCYRIDGFTALLANGDHAIGADILFQNGPIPQVGNNGLTIEALLAVIAHRLEGFQNGPFASADNEEALDGVLKAMGALQRRTRNRIARQVEGTYQA